MTAPPMLVRCDVPGCGWEATMRNGHEWKAWHNVACPACGRGPILTDKDAAMLTLTFGYEMLSHMLFPNAPRIHVKLDSRDGSVTVVGRENP